MSVLRNSKACYCCREALQRTATNELQLYLFSRDAVTGILTRQSILNNVYKLIDVELYVNVAIIMMVTYRACSTAQVVHGSRKHISQVQRETRCGKQTALRMHTQTQTHAY